MSSWRTGVAAAIYLAVWIWAMSANAGLLVEYRPPCGAFAAYVLKSYGVQLPCHEKVSEKG